MTIPPSEVFLRWLLVLCVRDSFTISSEEIVRIRATEAELTIYLI